MGINIDIKYNGHELNQIYGAQCLGNLGGSIGSSIVLRHVVSPTPVVHVMISVVDHVMISVEGHDDR